jgi:hypothetical protein
MIILHSNHPEAAKLLPKSARFQPILQRKNCLAAMAGVTVTFGYFRPLTLSLDLLRSKSGKRVSYTLELVRY